MAYEFDTPPERLVTAGTVDEMMGDVDAEPEDSSLTVLDTDGEIGPDQGGTPDDAAGESGISGH
jgi:hypothetical protein